MKLQVRAALAFVCLVSVAAAESLVLRAGALIDGLSDTAQQPGVLVIKDDKIVGVGPGAPLPPDARVIDLGPEVTLLPGLIDCHVHLAYKAATFTLDERVKITPAGAAIYGVVNARDTLLAGFTTVRDVGGGELVDMALRDAIQAGRIVGPRMFVAGPAMSITGGHGDRSNAWGPYYQSSLLSGVANGVDACRAKARWLIQQRVDLIKIMGTGGVLSHHDMPDAPGYSFEEIKAIVEEAARFDRHVASHCHGTEGIITSARAGCRSIDHGSFQTPESARVMVEHGTYLVPTLYVGQVLTDPQNPLQLKDPARMKKAEEVAPRMLSSFRLAVEAGVKIAFGTDAGVFGHGTQTKEFKIMVDNGMTPMQAVKSATSVAAELLERSGEFGSLRPGLYADVVAVRGNPLEDITILEKVGLVVKEGRVHKNEYTSAR